MGENNNEGRQALGDVTNQLGNRGFSTSKPLLSGRKRAAENSDDDDSRFWKQVSLVVDKLDKEIGGVTKYRKVCEPNEVGLSPLKGGKTYRLQTASPSGNVGSTDGNRENVDVNVDHVEKEGGFMGDCCEKSCVEVGKECRGEETRGLSDHSDVGESGCNAEELGTRVVSDCGKSVFGNIMTSSMSESAETSRFTESQEIRSFGLQRCTLLKGDGSNSLAAGVDLLKNCSCSFCTKAAYIWSDLQCKDVKGRISTLAKSQKEASKLARTHSTETAMGVTEGNSNTAPHLETGLTTLWKSLFLHMEKNFAAENSQLQSNFAALKDIREDYKLNLEMMNAMPPDIQQCSSDASDRSYDKPDS